MLFRRLILSSCMLKCNLANRFLDSYNPNGWHLSNSLVLRLHFNRRGSRSKLLLDLAYSPLAKYTESIWVPVNRQPFWNFIWSFIPTGNMWAPILKTYFWSLLNTIDWPHKYTRPSGPTHEQHQSHFLCIASMKRGLTFDRL